MKSVLAWWDRVERRYTYRIPDRKSTRLNSSHRTISYAVFCLKKKISVDRSFVTDSRPVRLSWEVYVARRLHIRGIGEFTGTNWIEVHVRHDIRFAVELTPAAG